MGRGDCIQDPWAGKLIGGLVARRLPACKGLGTRPVSGWVGVLSSAKPRLCACMFVFVVLLLLQFRTQPHLGCLGARIVGWLVVEQCCSPAGWLAGQPMGATALGAISVLSFIVLLFLTHSKDVPAS
jgi:hypothetical protein